MSIGKGIKRKNRRKKARLMQKRLVLHLTGAIRYCILIKGHGPHFIYSGGGSGWTLAVDVRRQKACREVAVRVHPWSACASDPLAAFLLSSHRIAPMAHHVFRGRKQGVSCFSALRHRAEGPVSGRRILRACMKRGGRENGVGNHSEPADASD